MKHACFNKVKVDTTIWDELTLRGRRQQERFHPRRVADSPDVRI